jgi:hypothetical protein
MQLVDQIEQLGVDGMDLVGAPVPQDVIDVVQRSGEIFPSREVLGGQRFAGIDAPERKRSGGLHRREDAGDLDQAESRHCHAGEEASSIDGLQIHSRNPLS